MGDCSTKEAEAADNQKKLSRLDDDLKRIKDAETLRLKMNGPDGKKLDVDALLSRTLQELIEEVAAEFGVLKEFSKDVEMHLSGYQLKPVTKIVREFTELCPDSEIEVHGIEKAKEAMKQRQQQQRATSVNVHHEARAGDLAELKLVVEFAPERIHEPDNLGRTPLHWAAQNDQEAAVSLLLSAGADVNATDNSNETPTARASGGRVKQLLRDAGGH